MIDLYENGEITGRVDENRVDGAWYPVDPENPAGLRIKQNRRLGFLKERDSFVIIVEAKAFLVPDEDVLNALIKLGRDGLLNEPEFARVKKLALATIWKGREDKTKTAKKVKPITIIELNEIFERLNPHLDFTLIESGSYSKIFTTCAWADLKNYVQSSGALPKDYDISCNAACRYIKTGGVYKDTKEIKCGFCIRRARTEYEMIEGEAIPTAAPDGWKLVKHPTDSPWELICPDCISRAVSYAVGRLDF